MIDNRDVRILELLQEDARRSNAEIARDLGIAPSAVLERIRKLERTGVIQGYSARLAPEALGAELLAFVFVQADERLGDESAAARLAELPEVQELHHVAGEDCYLAKVRCASPTALGRLLREQFGAIPQVKRTRSTIVLGTKKETLALRVAAGFERAEPELQDVG
jgi:Lrp/AsnC family transcriptional regulator, leucine-responsive regulatory protein